MVPPPAAAAAQRKPHPHQPEGNQRPGESLMHRFDLAPGEHTVKLTVRGEAYGGSLEEKKGRNVVVKDLIVFRK